MLHHTKLKCLVFSWVTLFPLCMSVTFAQESFVAKDAVLKLHESREIPSKVAGVIQKSHIQEGSVIQADQLLMEIDSRLAKLNVEKLANEEKIAADEAASTVEVEYLEKSIGVANAELSRALESNRRLPGAVPKSEVDQLMLVAQRAIAEKDKAVFDMQVMAMQTAIRSLDLSMGRRQLEEHQIQSPIAGMVVEVYKKQGEWVNVSDPIAKVVQLRKLKAEIKVPASIALDNLLDTRAVFTPALSGLEDRTFEGTVVYVSPEANPVSRQIKVWVVIENEELKLVPGLVGQVELLRGESNRDFSAQR